MDPEQQPEQQEPEQQEPEHVDLHVDEEKVEAWNEVKSDYEVEPDGEPVPNSMDVAGFISDNADVPDDAADDGAAADG